MLCLYSAGFSVKYKKRRLMKKEGAAYLVNVFGENLCAFSGESMWNCAGIYNTPWHGIWEQVTWIVI